MADTASETTKEQQGIFAFITAEETAYGQSIPVADGYNWSMKDHIRLTTLYKNSQFSTGNSESERDNKPFKNILRPILNLQYRAEGFDVKDITLFVDNPDNYYKSFLVKKFHEKWALEVGLDTFIDEVVETYTDFGGVLVKDVNKARPEVVPWASIAFCDQSDFLSSPFGIKHNYSPSKLREMESVGWGDPNKGADTTIEDLITAANAAKKAAQTDQTVKTPGKQIEVYEVHGDMPESWLKDDGDPNKYVLQMQIVAFYTDKDNKRTYHTLFKGKKSELGFKLLVRDQIFGRALGMGGAEELFEAQVWTNYGEIVKKRQLDQAKLIYQTQDTAFETRNKTADVDDGEILVTAEGKPISQVNTQPINVPLFDKVISDWEAHAQRTGAATDALLGENPSAGSPFKLQDLVVTQGMGLHEYRQGKIATFVGEVYQDWIIPNIVRELSSGRRFLATLSLDELQAVADSVTENAIANMQKERVLSGELPATDLEVQDLKTKHRDAIMKLGNKRFLEIYEGEMKKQPIGVYANIAGKQKNLSKLTDKLVNIVRQVIAAPQIMDDPRFAKMFNEILEASGLSPIDFYQRPQQLSQLTKPVPSPVKLNEAQPLQA